MTQYQKVTGIWNVTNWPALVFNCSCISNQQWDKKNSNAYKLFLYGNWLKKLCPTSSFMATFLPMKISKGCCCRWTNLFVFARSENLRAELFYEPGMLSHCRILCCDLWYGGKNDTVDTQRRLGRLSEKPVQQLTKTLVFPVRKQLRAIKRMG